MTQLSILICLLITGPSTKVAPKIVGIWNTGTDNTKIEITEKDGVCSGKIISSDNPKAQIGKVLLKDVKSVDGEWAGKLFAPQKGEWMDAVLEAKNSLLEITVEVGWFSKTIEWTKE